jgi:hypothetical protein
MVIGLPKPKVNQSWQRLPKPLKKAAFLSLPRPARYQRVYGTFIARLKPPFKFDPP